MSTLNHEIRAAIESMYPDRARDLIKDALKDADAETYYLASLVALNEDQKRDFLQKALDLDPFHTQAYKALKELDKSLQKTEVPSQTAVSQPQNTFQPPAATSVPSASIPIPPPVSTTETRPATELEPSSPMIATPIQVTVTKSSASLYPIPWERNAGRQSLEKGITLDVIARDSNPDWLNVGITRNGTVQIVWVKTSDVSTPKQQSGVAWSIDDLPISAYEYNTPKEIAQIIRRKESDNKKHGLVFTAVVAAFFIFIISVIVSNNFGVIFGSLVGTGIIIASLYKRANDRAGIIRQSHVLKRIQQKAVSNAPRTYQPYTGWVTPTLEQIEKAERDYELDAQAARQKAVRNAVRYGVFAALVMGLLAISSPGEGTVDFVVAFLCFVALFVVSPIVSYMAVYASDEEKAMALVGVVAAVTLFATAANTSKSGAIQRRVEREEAERKAREAAAKASAEAERKRKEEEAKRLEQQRMDQQRQQQVHSTAQASDDLRKQVKQELQDKKNAWKDDYAAWAQERDWNIRDGAE